MNEVEYILRVILKARNDLGRAFAAAKTQLEAFTAAAKKADGDLDKLNTRISSMNTRIGNSTKKVKEWQAAIRAFSGDIDKADKVSAKSAKSIEAIGKESDTAAKKMVVHKRATEDLHKATKDLGNSLVKVADDFKKGGRDRDDYVRDLKRIISEYDKLERKTKFGSDQQQAFRQAGNAARGLLKELDDLTKAQEKLSASAKKGHETRRKNEAINKAEAATAAALAKRIAEVESADRKLTAEFRRGSITQAEHNAGARELAAAYRRLAGEFDLGSAKARKFGVDAERLRT